MSKIEEIASKHLGKAGDGTVVKPYVTPDSVDPSLLVGIPRELNRTAYGIEEQNLPFDGIDRWNSYEFSTLTDNGFPVSGTLVYTVPSDSPNITESKSVKLYLNSYNMAKMGKTVVDVIQNVELDVYNHIAACAGTPDVMVALHIPSDISAGRVAKPIFGDFVQLETYVDVENITFDQYNEDPKTLLVVGSNGRPVRWKSFSLRSNCRVTNQPDWGDVFIHIKGNKTVTPESLLQYIVSMRKENHFHEEICECIYKRLHDLLEPEELFVSCLYTRRGGIDINPVRASSNNVMYAYAAGLDDVYSLNEKTMRQ